MYQNLPTQGIMNNSALLAANIDRDMTPSAAAMILGVDYPLKQNPL